MALPMLGDDGLTNAEGEVMDSLLDAFEAYSDLPVQHADEPAEFRYHVHMLQGLLAVRIARRAFPKGWRSDAPDGDGPL